MEIWTLVGAAFLVAIGFGLVAPALPTFARGFGVGVAWASAVISAFAFMRLGFAPAAGRLVNTFGERRMFLLGLLVVAGSTSACAVAQSYWQLLVFRAVGGVGSIMFAVSALSLLVRLTAPAQRGRASGMWASGFLLGNITGPLLGGGLTTVSIRAPFVVYAVELLITALVSGLILRRSPRAGRRPVGTQPAITLRAALAHPAYRAALVGNFADGWLVFGVRVSLVPLFVVEVLGRAPSWAGIALAVFAIGNAITLLFAGRWADSCGRRPPLLVGLFVSAVATGAIGFFMSLPAFLVTALVSGLGSGLINPPLNATVGDVVGSAGLGGPILARFQMTADLGTIVGPVVSGFVAEAISFRAAFLLTGVVSLAAFAVWLWAPETLPTSAAGSAARGSTRVSGADTGG
jgi:MFS transporter, DHA1 family, tetracycline resistance protein